MAATFSILIFVTVMLVITSRLFVAVIMQMVTHCPRGIRSSRTSDLVTHISKRQLTGTSLFNLRLRLSDFLLQIHCFKNADFFIEMIHRIVFIEIISSSNISSSYRLPRWENRTMSLRYKPMKCDPTITVSFWGKRISKFRICCCVAHTLNNLSIHMNITFANAPKCIKICTNSTV